MKDTKMVIVSYPKSGRTWLKVLLDQYQKASNIKLPKILWTHLGYGHVSEPEVNSFLSAYRDVPRVFLTRDLSDSLVSYYHDDKARNASKLVGCEQLDQYVREYSTHIIEFYRKANRINFQLQFSYEEMQQNIEECVLSVIKLLGADVDRDALRQAIKECEFSALQKSERSGEIDMRVGEGHMARGFFKTRKGKVGSAKEELSPETYEYLKKEFEL